MFLTRSIGLGIWQFVAEAAAPAAETTTTNNKCFAIDGSVFHIFLSGHTSGLIFSFMLQVGVFVA